MADFVGHDSFGGGPPASRRCHHEAVLCGADLDWPRTRAPPLVGALLVFFVDRAVADAGAWVGACPDDLALKVVDRESAVVGWNWSLGAAAPQRGLRPRRRLCVPIRIASKKQRNAFN